MAEGVNVRITGKLRRFIEEPRNAAGFHVLIFGFNVFNKPAPTVFMNPPANTSAI